MRSLQPDSSPWWHSALLIGGFILYLYLDFGYLDGAITFALFSGK